MQGLEPRTDGWCKELTTAQPGSLFVENSSALFSFSFDYTCSSRNQFSMFVQVITSGVFTCWSWKCFINQINVTALWNKTMVLTSVVCNSWLTFDAVTRSKKMWLLSEFEKLLSIVWVTLILKKWSLTRSSKTLF